MDASVAAKWVVEEEHSAEAALLLDGCELHAPDHWLAEAANVLWSKVYKGDLDPNDAAERLVVLLRAPIIGSPISGLMAAAFALSAEHSITVYDALYVALARDLGIPCVTGDRKLVRRLHDTSLAASLLPLEGLRTALGK